MIPIKDKYKVFMLEYLEPFDCKQTVIILVCKQISSDSFKSKSTNKLLN